MKRCWEESIKRKAHKHRMKQIDQFFNSTSIEELERMLENVIKGEVNNDRKSVSWEESR